MPPQTTHLPSRVACDYEFAVDLFAEVAITLRKLGFRDGRDLAKCHDLTVRVINRNTDAPATILENEHVADVFARKRSPQSGCRISEQPQALESQRLWVYRLVDVTVR